MKTTLEIPDDIFRQVKSQSALEGIKLKDFVVQALMYRLTNAKPASKSLRTVDFPLIKAKPGSLAVSNELIDQAMNEQLEAEAAEYAKFM